MSLRIATWNIERARSAWRRKEACRLMVEQDADVWVLTETRIGVSPGPDYRLIVSSEQRADADADERWVSIWSRLPRDHGMRVTRDSEYAACAVVEGAAGSPVAIYGTVLPWRGSIWRGHVSAGAVAFGAAVAAQAADWRDLMKEFPRICAAGDFNQDLSDTHYYWSRRAQRHLVRGLASAGLHAVTAGTRDPVRRLTDGTAACIDHVCLSDLLVSKITAQPIAWSPVTNGRKVSDHPGVLVTLVDV